MKAPLLGQKTALFGGVELPIRPNMGIFTQPISVSFGLPVAAVPAWLPGAELPLGVQVIAAPARRRSRSRIAHQLETTGVARPRSPRDLPMTEQGRWAGRNPDKDLVRNDVWRSLEHEGVAVGPAWADYPEFRRADVAAWHLAQTPEWKAAKTISNT